MWTLTVNKDFLVYSERQENVFYSYFSVKSISIFTFSTWYPKMSPPPLYRGGFQATMTKSFPVSTIHGVGGPGGTGGATDVTQLNKTFDLTYQRNIPVHLTMTCKSKHTKIVQCKNSNCHLKVCPYVQENQLVHHMAILLTSHLLFKCKRLCHSAF